LLDSLLQETNMEERVKILMEIGLGRPAGKNEVYDLTDHAVIRTLADAARSHEIRESILRSGMLRCVEWGAMSEQLIIEVCRLLGNLCYNNPQGRQFVVESRLLKQIDTSLGQLPKLAAHSKLFLVVPAFLQNFSIDNGHEVGQISDLLYTITTMLNQLMTTEPERVTYKPLEDLLLTIGEEETGLQLFNGVVLEAAVHMLRLSGNDPSKDLVSLLTTLCEADEKAQALVRLELHLLLIDRLSRHCYSNQQNDEEKSTEELCCELLAMATSSAISSPHHIDSAFIWHWLSSIDSRRLESLKLTTSDLDTVTPSSAILLASTGLIVLGNLCTSDANIDHLLMQSSASLPVGQLSRVDQLLNLLTAVSAVIPPPPTMSPWSEIAVYHANTAKLRHSLLGCLRNCCVNTKLREELLESGLHRQLLKMAAAVDAILLTAAEAVAAAAAEAAAKEAASSVGGTAGDNQSASNAVSVTPTERAGLLVKIVAVLRLLVQNSSAASKVVADDTVFIQLLVATGNGGSASSTSSSFSAALGQLNVETGRLFSSLITQAGLCVGPHLVGAGCLPYLVSLLGARHPVLVNQAVLPLCLLVVGNTELRSNNSVQSVDDERENASNSISSVSGTPNPTTSTTRHMLLECLSSPSVLDKLAGVLDADNLPDPIKQNTVKLLESLLMLEETSSSDESPSKQGTLRDSISSGQLRHSLERYCTHHISEVDSANSNNNCSMPGSDDNDVAMVGIEQDQNHRIQDRASSTLHSGHIADQLSSAASDDDKAVVVRPQPTSATSNGDWGCVDHADSMEMDDDGRQQRRPPHRRRIVNTSVAALSKMLSSL